MHSFRHRRSSTHHVVDHVYGNSSQREPVPTYHRPIPASFLHSVETIRKTRNGLWSTKSTARFSNSCPASSPPRRICRHAVARLPIMIDDNYAPYAPGASTSQASINARRPYDPGVLGQNIFLITNQTASYNSLQFSVQRRLTHNLMLNGFYVWSHSFQSSNESAVGLAYAQDFANLWEERGPTDNDRRNMASISGIWNVDYYRGSNSFVKQIANGWTISSIVTLNSGAPVNIVTGSNKNFDSANNSRPNLVAGQNAFLDTHRNRTAAAAQWLNTAAFTANGPGLGIGPGGADGNTPRDYLRAPGYRDIDLGLFRNISFERFTLQLRGEATNAFNMVSLNAPTANLASALNGKITAGGQPRLIQWAHATF